VDAVSHVVRLPPSAVESCPPGVGGASTEHIAGIARDRGELVVLLDVGILLRGAAAGAAEAR